MTYIERRIAKRMAESPEYRAAYQEEEDLLARELELRRQLMGMVASMRKAQGLSQQQLAAKMRVSQARISQMERGQEPLSVDSLIHMIEALGGAILVLSAEEAEESGLEGAVGNLAGTNRRKGPGQRVRKGRP